MSRARRAIFAAGAAAASFVVACSSGPEPVKPTSPLGPACAIETTLATAAEPAARAYPPQYWFTLLIQGMRSSGRFPQPTRDCSGWKVEARDACPVQGSATSSEPEPLPFDALEPSHLVLAKLAGAGRLAWVTTGRFSNGELVGPVGLVELAPRGMVVKAIGTLRAFGARPKLRLERLGPDVVLVAEGHACEGGQETCDHGVRIVPLRRDRLAQGPLEDGAGGCAGSSLILLGARGLMRGPRGGAYQLQSAVTFGADAITVREELSVEPSSSVEGLVSRVRGERTLRVKDGRLIASGPSLLEKWKTREAR